MKASLDTRTQIINLWGERYCPHHIELDSLHNMRIIGEAIRRLPDPLKMHHIVEAVAALDMSGQLVRKQTGPTVVVKEVDKTPKLSKADIRQQLGLNPNVRTELDRGEPNVRRPNEEELTVIALDDLKTNSVMNDTLSLIRTYKGVSHSQTAKRQEELRGIFERFKSEVKDPVSAQRLLNTVKAKIDVWDDSSIR